MQKLKTDSKTNHTKTRKIQKKMGGPIHKTSKKWIQTLTWVAKYSKKSALVAWYTRIISVGGLVYEEKISVGSLVYEDKVSVGGSKIKKYRRSSVSDQH